MPNFKRFYQKTKDTVTAKWTVSQLDKIPDWVVGSVIWITIFRALAYGLELLLLVNNPITPLMAFAAVFGLQTWGILILVAVAILILGIVFKNSLLVTIGSLMCTAVWIGFSSCLLIGRFELGYGGRFVVTHLATGLTFGLLFFLQLKSIRKKASLDD